jgi:hypothetical protein
MTVTFGGVLRGSENAAVAMQERRPKAPGSREAPQPVAECDAEVFGGGVVELRATALARRAYCKTGSASNGREVWRSPPGNEDPNLTKNSRTLNGTAWRRLLRRD